MNRIVLDASVALAWFVDRTVAPYAVRVKNFLASGGRAVVPDLWRVEVPNGLVVSERRGILMSSEISEAIESFELLLGHSIESIQEPVSPRRILSLARQSRLTAYDACYLSLARDLHLPLATLDRRLTEAAKQAGVAMFA